MIAPHAIASKITVTAHTFNARPSSSSATKLIRSAGANIYFYVHLPTLLTECLTPGTTKDDAISGPETIHTLRKPIS